MHMLTKDQKRVLVALGKAIRKTRLSKNLTRARLALLANVDPSTVGRIECGNINVRVRTLARLAKALNVSIAKLLDEAGL